MKPHQHIYYIKLKRKYEDLQNLVKLEEYVLLILKYNILMNLEELNQEMEDGD